jgi:hypothetical protein
MRTQWQAWTSLSLCAAVLLGSASAACQKAATEGEPIPWSHVVKARGELYPAACAHKEDGKTYVVEGFPHWPDSTLCTGNDCRVDVHPNNDADGEPAESAEGYVRLTVKMKGVFGGFVEEPELLNATAQTTGVASGKRTTTTGTIAKDSLALSLSDKSVVNNRTRVRAFFQIRDVNGTCELRYVGGARAL